MIFSSARLFLVSSTLRCVVTATRPSQHWSDALISTLDTNGSAEDGWREVHVKAAGSLTPLGANYFEEPGFELKLGKEVHFKAADPLTQRQTNHSEGTDLEAPDASGATPASQLAVLLLAQQKQFYIEEEERPQYISFAKGPADSLNIYYLGDVAIHTATWQMSAGDPSQFGYMYRGGEWEQFDVQKALVFFVGHRNLPAIDKHTEPFLLSGVHDMGGDSKNLALVFGYVNVDKEELEFVKFLYLPRVRGQLNAGDFKACESFNGGNAFRSNHGKPRWEVLHMQDPYRPRSVTDPLLTIQCGYTLKPTS